MSRNSNSRSNKSKHQSNSKTEVVTEEVNSTAKKEADVEDATLESTYYNTKAIKSKLWIIIIAVFLGAMIIIPWVISCIELLFRVVPFWKNNPDLHQLNLGILPDFLGGMVGIIVGFGIELILFNKLRILDKYEALKTPLELELNSIFKSLINKLTYSALVAEKNDEYAQKILNDENLKEYTETADKHKENYKDKYLKYFELKLITIDDIVLSAENNVVFCKLPGLSKKDRKARSQLFTLLISIYSNICRYNEEFDMYVALPQKISKDDSDKYTHTMMNYMQIILVNILKFSYIVGITIKKPEEK